MQDTIRIVLAHANNNFRKRLLKECLSNLDGPILVVSNYQVDEETQTLCDWTLFRKDNPLLRKEEYSKYGADFSYFYHDAAGKRIVEPFEYDHTYAFYTLIQEGLLFAKSHGFTKAHIINYDYVIPNSELLENERFLNTGDFDAVMYRYDLTEHAGNYSTGFMSLVIDPHFDYFTQIKSKDEFYSKPYSSFEARYLDEITELKIRVVIKGIEQLKQIGLVNQEGILFFSKAK